MTRSVRNLIVTTVFLAASSVALPRMAVAQRAVRSPLGATDIDDIARLEMMEDRRKIDTLADRWADLGRLLVASHPEVRRRAAITVGRLADSRGVALLRAQPLDADTAIAAATVFAMGQLRDPATVPWLDSLLTNSSTAPTVAAEAAIALGKVPSPLVPDVLARFLTSAVPNARTNAAIGQALLSIGRAGPLSDLKPILKWTSSANQTIRWSATWALARLRAVAGIPALIRLAKDTSPLVRSWAIRGLGKPQADSANLGGGAEELLRAATRDVDRTVRTEAVRTLGSYSDPSAVALLAAALKSPDSWISVTAAEALGIVKAPATVGALQVTATTAGSCALRVTAWFSLLALELASPPEVQAQARDAESAAVVEITRVTEPNCRSTAFQALRRNRSRPPVGSPSRALVDALLNDSTLTGPRPLPPEPLSRTLADYRAIVERWVVPDYNGKPRPVVRWDTPRGPIDLELYPGDAPLAVDDFVRRTEAGGIVGTQFSRVVPDFVDQQETIRGSTRLRDEVNRHGLTRGNLAWASAGLDTGNPGYTLGHTPQPHNEGNFTSLGHVIRGMAAVDRIELGDRITAARMLPVGPSR